MVAATWAQPHPGRSATFWPPQFDVPYDPDLASELVAAVIRQTGESNVTLLQAIIDPADTRSEKLLTEQSFSHAAELIYLEWLTAPIADRSKPLLQFESYHPDHYGRLKEVIGQTYIDSLDCPMFDALRTLDEVLAGYQSTGDHHPDLWAFAVEKGSDVGALLLTKYRQEQQMELIYMGVVPGARSRGIGIAILRHAQQQAAQHRGKKLVLAVDAKNLPARELYDRAGFREWSQRRIYIYSLLRENENQSRQ